MSSAIFTSSSTIRIVIVNNLTTKVRESFHKSIAILFTINFQSLQGLGSLDKCRKLPKLKVDKTTMAAKKAAIVKVKDFKDHNIY
jgi:hypothetical protein